MLYNLFVTAPLDNGAVAAALAESFGLPLHEVDVADDDTDQEGRNWGAAVLCKRDSVLTDVRTYLDISTNDAVAAPPSAPELAAVLARVLGRSVIYSDDSSPMSAHWLAAGDGTVTRARLDDSYDEVPVYTVDAVEAPVPDLPHVKIARLPEIVREQRKPTPVSDDLATSLNALGTDRTGDIGSPNREVGMRLGAWEQFVRTLADGWAPAGWYPADMYAECLVVRDELEVLGRQLPRRAAELLVAAVATVDREFVELTVPALAWQSELRAMPGTDVPGEEADGWWWRRRPEPLPW